MKQIRLTEIGGVTGIWVACLALAVPVVAASSYLDDPTTLQRLKAQTSGIQMYCADADGHFPNAYRVDPAGPTRWNASVETPAGWRRDTTDERRAQYAATYPNNVAPYWPNLSVLEIPDAPLIDIGAPYKVEDTIRDPLPVGFTMNGLLSSYPQASVTKPNIVPLVWTGIGHANSRGLAITTPALNCDIRSTPTAPCVFNPEDTMMSGVLMWSRGDVVGGVYFGMVDGSAKRVSPNTANVEGTEDPWKYEGDKPIYYWTDGHYPKIFRPDRGD